MFSNVAAEMVRESAVAPAETTDSATLGDTRGSHAGQENLRPDVRTELAPHSRFPDSCLNSLEKSVAAAMEGLQQCRNECSHKLANKHSEVPLADVEQWCLALTKQLALVGDSLAEKLQACTAKLHARDEAIRRLRRQLDAKSPKRTRVPASPALVSPRGTTEARGMPKHIPEQFVPNSPMTSSHDVDGSHTPLRAEGVSSGNALPTFGSWPTEDDAAADVSPHSLASRTMSSTYIEKPAISWAQAQRRADGKPATRRCSSDVHALERAQQAHLRREVAHLQRGHVELVGQLRARDAQVEQLTSMIHELVAQRQIGLYKRQLNLQEDNHDFSQQRLHQRVGQHRRPPVAQYHTLEGSQQRLRTRPEQEDSEPRHGTMINSFSEGAGQVRDSPRVDSLRGGRRQPSSAFGAHQAPQDRRSLRLTSENSGRHPPRTAAAAAAAAVAAAAGDLDRSRPGQSPAAVHGVKKDRERSLGAPPHTPRGKLRDAIGHPTRVAVATPAARRRTSAARTITRSASVEERVARRLREAARSRP